MKNLVVIITRVASLYSCSPKKKSNKTSDPNSNTTPATDPWQIEIGNNSGLAVSDLPTVAYDVANEISNFTQDSQSSDKLTVLSPTLNSHLTEAPGIRVGSSNGGEVSIFEEIANTTKKKGSFTSSDFILRPGYPPVKSEGISYDLDITPTTVKGSISADNVIFNDMGLLLKANYDLYLQDGMWRGKMTGSFSKDGLSQDFTYDYDTPIVSGLEVFAIDASGNRIEGPVTNGGKVRMVLKANSNAPVNWLNTTWNSPNSNIIGGGSGMQSFSEGSCPNSVPAWGFCEVSRGYWAYVQDYEISPYQPSGTYTWKMGVKNAAELTSKEVETSIQVNNSNFSASKPVITEFNITPDAGLGSGAGGSVLVEILAQSEIPVNWLTRTLNSPTSNVFGGGSGQTFISCETAGPKPALCGSNAAGYYYFSFSDTFTAWSENGSYTYSGFSVQNASNISSDDFPQARTFVIAGNPVATTPNISSGQIYKVANYGDDPLTTGSLITGTCLVNTAQGSSLTVALVLAVDSSNAPVDWLTRSFTGPSSNLEGGGSGTNSFDLGSGNFRVVHYNTIASPNFAPQGSYYYDQLSVKNAGNKTSNVFGGVGLNFVMKATCP